MSSRGLKILVDEILPAELKTKINDNPWFHAAVLLLLLALGPFFIVGGYRGIRRKSIVSKGREYTGVAAVIIGALWIVTGMALVGTALLVGYQTLVVPRLAKS